jgi:putative ABC transport system permease protein
LTPAIRQVLKAFNQNLPLIRALPLRQLADVGLLPQRIAASVAGSLGTVGLLLAAVGIYWVTAFTVARRTREIGIRIALGASSGVVMGMVMRQTLTLGAIGSAIGLAVSLAFSRLLSEWLFGISPVDSIALGATIGVLAGTAVVATCGPARRASRVDPLVELKTD